jgi:hypothetical protein
MKVVCAWCGNLLSGTLEDTEVSHGICETCEIEFDKQLDRLRSGTAARGAD